MVRALWDHPHREQWGAGFGGQAIHTVLPHPTDPQQVTVAMSTGGVYRTFDGGDSWAPANRGIRRDLPAGGRAVPRVRPVRAQGGPRPVATRTGSTSQNHGGVYRTDDGGDTWTSIADGLPSDFGFPVVAHPRRPGTVCVFPLEGADGRFPVDGRVQRVALPRRRRHAGSRCATGLPDGFFTGVMRDAMCVDDADATGVYFGSRDGTVFGSDDEGDTWRPVAEHLPDVLCVRAAVV